MRPISIRTAKNERSKFHIILCRYLRRKYPRHHSHQTMMMREASLAVPPESVDCVPFSPDGSMNTKKLQPATDIECRLRNCFPRFTHLRTYTANVPLLSQQQEVEWIFCFLVHPDFWNRDYYGVVCFIGGWKLLIAFLYLLSYDNEIIIAFTKEFIKKIISLSVNYICRHNKTRINI